MILLSFPPVYFLPNTWESPGVDYPFPTAQVCAIIGLSIAAWFVSRSRKKWD